MSHAARGKGKCSPCARVTTCRLGERVTHYASLITAEKPLEAHRDYMAHRRSSMVGSTQLPPPADMESGGAYDVHADAATEEYADEGQYEYEGDDEYWEEYRRTIVQR